ncbi:transglycosylase SLT domain-containing protein [Albirhodobacter sp. R86504]|uniref:transglycosylase SLT domain-containing protein n=1 Tax=Albirhodobacter sp. R86504 TaxID=3093848 RepID=UPI003673232B
MGSHNHLIRTAVICILVSVSLSNTAEAENFAETCETAAVIASQQSGVPVSVLKAISLNETGRKLNGEFRPWAWTVNMEGAGHWFETRDEARAYVFKEFKRGARSFDVGCFQINYKWHHTAFSSIDEMFEPAANARYAAKFLTELYAEFGDWRKAAGAFHSRTPVHANRYTARFDKFREKFLVEDSQVAQMTAPASEAAFVAQTSYGDYRAQAGAHDDIPSIPDIVQVANAQTVEPTPRVNRYPLLRTGGGGGLASLVPMNNAAAASQSLFSSPIGSVIE